MTVIELIERLQKLPQNARVTADQFNNARTVVFDVPAMRVYLSPAPRDDVAAAITPAPGHNVANWKIL